MAQFEPYKRDIERSGNSAVFIAAERRGGLMSPESFIEKHTLAFPLLLDEDRSVTKAYGVYHRLGLDAVNIARPASFVVDRTGVVKYIYVGSSQTDRAPIEELLGALKSARNKQRV